VVLFLHTLPDIPRQTAGLILIARKSARHHRTATVVVFVGMNVAYALLVSHNYRMVQSRR
jgi:hypothetical protein